MATSTRSGDVLAGRYRLIDLLSESGGGRFWRARDAVLERFVALHVIAEDDQRAAGLVAAARTSASVLDSRILRVLDAEAEDGRCFVVNEWGTGISLDILTTHAGPLEARRAAWLVADVADAIARAHAAGVTHGRLNPENVLIDRYGSVRIIGMCVDAALHGLAPGDVQGDLEDLGGLLYCALTATWPGPSGSIVPAAPRENHAFLSPRQVRAGVPKPLDLLWRELDSPTERTPTRRRRRSADHLPDVSSASRIAAELREFVGDPSGMAESLAQSIPPINELRPVWLPAMADPLPHDSSRDDIPVVPPAPEPPEIAPDPVPETPQETGEATPSAVTDSLTDSLTDSEEQSIPLVSELPTEAGMPIFSDDADDDVQWLRTRSTPPPPPPPFEEPPERPLFAPGPPSNRNPAHPTDAVRPSPEAPHPGGPDAEGKPPPGYWPWDASAPHVGDTEETTEQDSVPGRSWLRLAMAVALAVLLLCSVAVAFNLGRGRTALGGDRDEPDGPAAPTSSATAETAVIAGVSATDFDPLGDPATENPDAVRNVLDGDPATTWRTVTYKDQLGPGGLKTGVGLLLDLGRQRGIASVDLRLVDETAGTVELHVLGAPPTEAPTASPAATATGGGRLRLAPSADSTETSPLTGRYLVLWWTSLPEVSDGFRAEIAEVVVRGE